MNFQKLLVDGLKLVHELSSQPIPGENKLAKLENLCVEILKTVDDVVKFLPLGFGIIAGLVVDNPISDGLQREHIARPLAELVYQIWKALHSVGGVEAVNKMIVSLGGAPVSVV
jgi:hypothetical protein